jgi:predicted nucleic acid-binding protein
MATIPASNPSALVIDANVAVAISSRESGRDAIASAELNRYASLGYEWYAPGAILTETLYALCQKHQAGLLTSAEFDDAVNEFELLMGNILPPPDGEATLAQRAHAIGKGYGCSRSADSVYIALAESLAQTRPTILLTFDQSLPNQAARNAPTVTVQLL